MNQEQTESEARTAAFKNSWEFDFFQAFSQARTLCVLLILSGSDIEFFMILLGAEMFLMFKRCCISSMIARKDIEDHGWWQAGAFFAFVGYSMTAAVVIFGVDVHSEGSIAFIVILFMPLPFDIMLLKYSPWYRKWEESRQNAPYQLV